MNWDDYDAFCHVVAHGSFTAAAQAMRRPKSSVSASVTRLEAALNSRLLERTTRRVRVTDAGASLYQSVSPLLNRLREVTVEAQGQGACISGTLRLAAPYEFGAHHLGAVACRLMSQYPQLEVVIDVEHASIDLFERQYDIVFSMTDHELASSSIVATRVFTLERELIASPGLLAQRLPVERPEELAGLPLLASSTDTEWAFIEPGGGRVCVPITTPRLRSTNANVRMQAAIAGLGVACLTTTYCEEAIHAGRLRQLLPDFVCAPLRVYALLPARRFMPPKVRVFLDTLSAMSAAHPEPWGV